MVPNQIRREIQIDAPIDVVWQVITQPEHLTKWFPDSAELDLRPGGQGRFGWDGHGTSVLRVVDVDVPHRFSYRWCHEEGTEPLESNSLLVTFELTPSDGGTRLQLTESGYAGVGWPEDQKVTVFGEHEGGWVEHTDRLVDAAIELHAAAARS